MKVSVRFYGHLADLVEQKTKLIVDLIEGATISNLLDELLKHSKFKQHLLNESGELESEITFLKNGREIKFLQGIETVLESNDEIQIFPLVAGG